MRHKNFAWRLTLSLVLIAGLMPGSAHADDGENAIPEWLRATSHFEPIGTVQSFGRVTVDGRQISLEKTLWGGELLEVADEASARVSLSSVGQVMLSGGAAVRISVRTTETGEDNINRSLVASLINGQVVVELRPEASAYIETQSSVLMAASGAKFRAGVSEGETQVYRLGGEVRVEPQQPLVPSIYVVRPVVREQATGRVLKGAPGTVHAQGRVELARLVKKRRKPRMVHPNSFMPEQDQPAADVEIKFTLDPPTFGQLDPEITRTNQYGVAYTNFTPLTNQGEAKIITTVVENPVDKHVGKIVFGKAPGLFRKRNIIIGAVAIIATTVVIFVASPTKRSIERVPPIVVNPPDDNP